MIKDCLSSRDVNRLPFDSITKRLDLILVDTAIYDKPANVFWRRSFLGQYSVPWEKFVTLFFRFLKVVQRRDSILSMMNDPNTDVPEQTVFYVKCLDALATNNGSVDIETFGRIASWFGPVTPTRNGVNVFLDKVLVIIGYIDDRWLIC